MTKNITSLRKAGRLKEAYEEAERNLSQNPTDIWCKRDMAWVLYEFIKQKSNAKYKADFLKCLDKLIELDLGDDEEILYNSVGFAISGMLSSLIRAEYFDNEYFNQVFQRIKLLKIKKKSQVYSSLLTVMLRAKNWWNGYEEFCNWWNFDNFMDEDFNSVQLENSKKILSLAERVVMSYCKILLESNSNSQIEKFLPWLDEFSNMHRNYIYLPYYNAKLLLKVGKRDLYWEKMKIFAVKKSTEFWVWELLGDYYSDKNMQLKFYLKGLSCKSKLEMSIKLREKTAWLLKDANYLKEALSEFLLIENIRNKNKWNITAELSNVISEIKRQGIVPTINNTDFYKSMSEDVESIVFGKRINRNSQKKNEQFDFEGKIAVSPNGFGFVKFNKKSIYVPSNLVKNSNIENGNIVKGKYIVSFDKKKNQEGFKATTICIKN